MVMGDGDGRSWLPEVHPDSGGEACGAGGRSVISGIHEGRRGGVSWCLARALFGYCHSWRKSKPWVCEKVLIFELAGRFTAPADRMG